LRHFSLAERRLPGTVYHFPAPEKFGLLFPAKLLQPRMIEQIQRCIGPAHQRQLARRTSQIAYPGNHGRRGLALSMGMSYCKWIELNQPRIRVA
jgi:hypothetical protein